MLKTLLSIAVLVVFVAMVIGSIITLAQLVTH